MGSDGAERQVRYPVPAVTLICVITVLLFLVRAVAIEQCVKVRITNCVGRSAAFAYGPVTLCAETRVTPDEKHRWLTTVWDYAPPDALMPDLGMDEPGMGTEPPKQNGAVGSSERSLNGAEQPIRNDTKMHHLEGGTYLVTASVYTDESKKKLCGRATARVTIQ